MCFATFRCFTKGSVAFPGLMCRIYLFRIHLKNQDDGQILFCSSNPCTKSNIRNNRYVPPFFRSHA